MKILLLGKNGQVGWELQRSLAPLGELIALDRAGKDGLCGDLTDLEGLRRTISIVKPNIIINAAAYTAVDNAENDKVNTNIVNAQAPRVLAEEALKVGAWLVHYSTDYVSKTDPYMKENPIGNKEMVLKNYTPTPFIRMPIAQ